jgi:hypothetical protein
LQPKNPSKPYYEGYWLGANDRTTEGKFVWAATGQPVTYTNWDGNNPDNYKEEDCAQILTSNPSINGRWNDINCDSPVNTDPRVFQNTMCERITSGGKVLA